MRRLVLSLLCMAASQQATAEMLARPTVIGAADASHVSAVFVLSDVEYEDDDSNTDSDVERTILGVEYAYGLSADTDFMAQFGFIVDSEIDNFDDDGAGFLFGAGARSMFYREAELSVHGFGLFSYQQEEFEFEAGAVDYELKVTTWEVHAGAVASYAATATIHPYGGAELIVPDGGEIESDPGSGDSDLERDDIFNLKLGCVFKLDSFDVRPEVTIFGEQTFLVAAGTSL